MERRPVRSCLLHCLPRAGGRLAQGVAVGTPLVAESGEQCQIPNITSELSPDDLFNVFNKQLKRFPVTIGWS